MLADDRRSWQLGTDAVWRRTEELTGTEGSDRHVREMKRIALEAAHDGASPLGPAPGLGSLDPRA